MRTLQKSVVQRSLLPAWMLNVREDSLGTPVYPLSRQAWRALQSSWNLPYGKMSSRILGFIHLPKGKELKQESSEPLVEFKFIQCSLPSLLVLSPGPSPQVATGTPPAPCLTDPAPLWASLMRQNSVSSPLCDADSPPLYARHTQCSPPQNCLTCTGHISQPQTPFE